MFCVKCGAENPESSKFCKNCGAPINEIPTVVIPSQDAQPPYQAPPQQEQPQHQTPPQQTQSYEQPTQFKPIKKKKKGCLISILVVVGLLAVLIIAAVLNGGEIGFSTANIKNAVTASQIDMTTFEPIVTSDVFPQTIQVIYVTAYIKNVPGDTSISANWTYIPSGEVLSSDPVVLVQDGQIQFNVEMPSGFYQGEYQIDLILNDKIEETLYFSVQ